MKIFLLHRCILRLLHINPLNFIRDLSTEEHFLLGWVLVALGRWGLMCDGDPTETRRVFGPRTAEKSGLHTGGRFNVSKQIEETCVHECRYTFLLFFLDKTAAHMQTHTNTNTYTETSLLSHLHIYTFLNLITFFESTPLNQGHNKKKPLSVTLWFKTKVQLWLFLITLNEWIKSLIPAFPCFQIFIYQFKALSSLWFDLF